MQIQRYSRWLILLTLTASVQAETIYKIVDEQGNVSYSHEPPASGQPVSKIKIDTPPSQEQVEAAKSRHERNLEAARIMDENRQSREQMIAEENRQKQKNQQKIQQQLPPSGGQQNYQNDKYPYYHPPYGARPPYRPGRPPFGPGNRPGSGPGSGPGLPSLPERPVNLPAR